MNAKTQGDTPQEFKCEKCGAEYKDKQHLGIHKLAAHGIRGHSKSAKQRAIAKARREQLAKVQESDAIDSTKISTEIKRDKQGKYLCPECLAIGIESSYEKLTGLGSHRRQHGVAGSSASVVAMRKRKTEAVAEQPIPAPALPEAPAATPISTMKIKPKRNGKFVCPECGIEMLDRRQLGIHRSHDHGVKGMTASSIRARSVRREAREAKAQEKKLGLTRQSPQTALVQNEDQTITVKSVKIIHGELEYGGNNPSTDSHEHEEDISQITITLAFAKCESIIDQYAKAHDCSYKELTLRVAELLSRSAGR
jgi:predicted RNA-binding Zn-ribbon protein involved in translation (DUF1610 family)